jgi:hypothetical protein
LDLLAATEDHAPKMFQRNGFAGGGMTDIRSSGFGSKLELQRHLDELDDEAPAEDPIEDMEIDDLDAARREIAWLRKEVADLRERLAVIRDQTEDLSPGQADDHPWLRIAAAIATTFVLGSWFSVCASARRAWLPSR